MQKFFTFIIVFVLLVLCQAANQSVFAQVTSSSMSGYVLDKNKEGLPGANVVATHLPSGTQYGAGTLVDGGFRLPSMRTGGPYKIVVTFIGYKEQVKEGIYLSLGTTANIDFILAEEGTEIEGVEVVADKNDVFSSDRTGASSNFSKETLNSLPTISRSLNDFTRMTPQASGSSFGGQDNRFNNLTIDGSIFNNSFGLASQPGGQTNATPISLDAVEEIQVNLAPYDVRQGGFVGAGINAVTRSGTNEISGSAFWNTQNQSFLGKKADGNDVTVNKFDKTQAGFRLGGPIIKNKLFFFVNGEIERRSDPATTFTANRGTGAANETRVLASDLDQLSNFMKEKFNYNVGNYDNYNLQTYSDKFLAKIDYNINKNHKLSIRYNYLRSYREILPSNSGVVNGGRSGNLNAMNLSSSNYTINNDIYSTIAELNSTFGSRFSNNLIVGFTANRDYRSSESSPFPLIDIQKDGSTYTSFGYEQFTPNNKLDTDTWQLQNNLTYYGGKHTITAGVNMEYFTFVNGFTPNYYGNFQYRSLDDFYRAANQFLANPNTTTSPVSLARYQYQYSAIEGGGVPLAETKVLYMGAYLQDEIQVKRNLKVTAGIRIDVPSFANTALENKASSQVSYLDGMKYNTSKLPETNILFSPRVGFNWDVFDNKKTQVRGGTGLFTGRPAFVWISNQVSNNGVLLGAISQDNTTAFPFNTNVNQFRPATPTLPTNYDLALTDPNFKFPQVMRYNIAVDQQLPWGLVGTAEFLYTMNVNNVSYINANLEPATAKFSGPDQRDRFNGYGLTGANQNNANRINDNAINAIVLKNTGSGDSFMATFKLERPFKNGFYAMLAYNFGMTKDIISAGSVASSSWQGARSVNGNNRLDLTYSDNDTRHRFIGSVSYRKEYLNFGSTAVNLFFQSQTQNRANYTYGGDFNGDQNNANDLIYIPKEGETKFLPITQGTGAAAVTLFTAQQQADAWEAYIKQDEYLSARRGEYAERNAVVMPMLTNIDFNITQEFFVKAGGKRNTIQFRFDVFNVGNFLNNAWGVGKVFNTTQPLIPAGVDATGYPQFRMQRVNNALPTETYRSRTTIADVWSAQFGIRYIFN